MGVVRIHRAADAPWEEKGEGARLRAVALDRVMLTYFEVEPGATFPAHRHESEQITMVLEGHLIFDVEGIAHRLGAGDTIAVPSGVLHAVRAGEEGARAVDAWSDPAVGIPGAEADD